MNASQWSPFSGAPEGSIPENPTVTAPKEQARPATQARTREAELAARAAEITRAAEAARITEAARTTLAKRPDKAPTAKGVAKEEIIVPTTQPAEDATRVPASFVPIQSAILMQVHRGGQDAWRKTHMVQIPRAAPARERQERQLALAEYIHTRGPLFLVYDDIHPVDTLAGVAAQLAKGGKVYLTTAPFTGAARTKYTAPLTLTAVGRSTLVVPGLRQTEPIGDVALTVSGDTRDERLHLPPFFRMAPVLEALFVMAAPPTLPQAIRDLTAPFAESAPTTSVRAAFEGNFVTTDFTIAAGTAFYHTTGFIGDDGTCSHTQTAGAKIVLPTASSKNIVAEFRAFLQAYPMIGTVALTTRRPVNATSRAGVATAMYHATQPITGAQIMRGAAPSIAFLHLIAPAGNVHNDEFVSQLQELTDRMRDDSASAGLCLVLWGRYPKHGLTAVDSSEDVTLVFVQTLASMKTGFLVPSKNLFTCAEGAKKPLLEVVYNLLPKYMTNVATASEF
jgi:hypothetical protein